MILFFLICFCSTFSLPSYADLNLNANKTDQASLFSLNSSVFDLKWMSLKQCDPLVIPPKPFCNKKKLKVETSTTKVVKISIWKEDSRSSEELGLYMTSVHRSTECYYGFWGPQTKRVISNVHASTPPSSYVNPDILLAEMSSKTSKDLSESPEFICSYCVTTQVTSLITSVSWTKVSLSSRSTVESPSGFEKCDVAKEKVCVNTRGDVLILKSLVKKDLCPYIAKYQDLAKISYTKKESNSSSSTITISPNTHKLLFWIEIAQSSTPSVWCVNQLTGSHLYKDAGGYLISVANEDDSLFDFFSFVKNISVSREKRSVDKDMIYDMWREQADLYLEKGRMRDFELNNSVNRSKRDTDLDLFKDGMTELQRSWTRSEVQWAFNELTKTLNSDIETLNHQLCEMKLNQWGRVWRDNALWKQELASFLSSEPDAVIIDNNQDPLFCIPVIFPGEQSIQISNPLKWINSSIEVVVNRHVSAFLHPHTGVISPWTIKSDAPLFSFLIPLKTGCSWDLVKASIICPDFSGLDFIQPSDYLFSLPPMYTPEELFKLGRSAAGNPYSNPTDVAPEGRSNTITGMSPALDFLNPLTAIWFNWSGNLWTMIYIIMGLIIVIKLSMIFLFRYIKNKPYKKLSSSPIPESPKTSLITSRIIEPLEVTS